MKLTHLQLNTSTLRSPKEIMQLVLDQNIDIACFQEIVYPFSQTSPISAIAEEAGFNYLEGIHFKYFPNNSNVGVAIISKFPIIDYSRYYYNTPDYQPKGIGENDILGNVINDNSTDHFPGSRGLKHAVKSRCILTGLLRIEDKPFRLVTTHFTVSDLCTETEQMFEMSQQLKSYIQYSNDIPTIFSADLNVRAQSYSVSMLKSVMNLHTGDLKDTLSDNHVTKRGDFPDGLATDHVFSKHLKHISTEAIQINFADHKALVSEFNL